MNARHFKGSPCSVCGRTTRYIKKRSCVYCAKRRAKAWQVRNPELTKKYARITSSRQRMLPYGRANSLVRGAQKRAQKRGLKFDITPAWVAAKIRAGRCEVTGIPFVLNPRVDGHGHPYAPSLDRRIFGGGYTKKNTRVVVWQFNTARWNHGDAQLRKFIREWAKNEKKLL